MSEILHIELSDTFNKQRQTINKLIDYSNGNPNPTSGNGISTSSTNVISVKTSGDGLSFDASGNLVGNDAYPNLLTQVVLDPNGPSTIPTTITSTTIVFPEFDVIFGNKVYYGKQISDFETVHVPQTTMTVENGVDGAVFVYVNDQGQILQSLNSVSPANSSVQCLLGSYFRLNNQIQENSWKYTPWNGSTSKDSRFMNNGSISGGLLQAATPTTLSRDAVNVIYEGVNVDETLYLPNQITYEAESTYVTKKLWPGYDASVMDTSTIDTTHIYNITSEQVDDISSEDGYIILIPGIVAPTGQDVYLMGMSHYMSGTYDQIFPTMEDAESALYGLSLEFGNVASRVAWFGQSIIVKIGATDFRDKNQFRVIGSVPNIIRSYASLSGAGQGSRVEGLTIKANGSVIGLQSSKNTIDFDDGFTVLNSSENEVVVSVIDEVNPKISNCITKIPQLIKLELNSGTLTLKAGSKCYLKTDTTTPTISIGSDLTTTQTTNGTYFAIYDGSILTTILTTEYDYSTLPVSYSLPLALITVSGGSISSIDNIFNGFGFIGSTEFVLPGVKFLVPTGRNTDGTLKSTEYISESVITRTNSGSTATVYFALATNGSINTYEIGNYLYDNGTNRNYSISGSTKTIVNDVVFAKADQVSGGIITWTPRSAFHSVDYHDIEEIKSIQGKLLQQVFSTNWPNTTDPSGWPHNVIISTNSNLTMSTTLPSFDTSNPKILTWEVVIQNTNTTSPITLTWPSVYQPFNGENLISTIAPDTSVFLMLRRYTGNYVLVSHQGTQLNSQM